MKQFDIDSLSKNNGKEGQPTYIVHQGRVIDVTESKLWKNGFHMKRHHAGNDLTTDIKAAPHGLEVLDRYPQVGELAKEPVAEINIPPLLNSLITMLPMLRRHPHPMTVHFPIVFMSSTTVFTLLYLITGNSSFETTAFHCLGGGVLLSIIAILTGFYTWWLNYYAKPVRAVKIKQFVSIVMLLSASTAFIWRLSVPDILQNIEGANYLYLLLTISLFPLVTIIGWFGAALTFPTEED
jgi:predicted heme/steroid binding protein/uncharacterized membrane protein